ncbi:hypothetical protein AGLY_012165 [Aphis glycines]|uniref:PiggyBac transposable element-derived protein domain-containing protein n=1 Tax=Aphis glycines TaxID=307491 RepID=A0A6G0T9B5_APHGL|nr:hypothetical protein AGLY_012165 [Aphis glycines]
MDDFEIENILNMSDDDVYSTDEFSEFDDTDADEDYFPEGIEHLQNNSESEASITDEIATISRQQIQSDQVSTPNASINIQQTNQNVAIWGTINTTVNYSNFAYNSTRETVGINPDIYETMHGGSPWEFLSLFLDNEVFNLIVTETNRYAGQLLSTPLRRHSRLNAWKETNAAEIKQFLGIIMWMGLEHLPTIQNYWAKKGIYSSKISKYMKVKRFELLLRTFHVSNNHECPPGDRLFKVRGLVDLLVSKYKRAYIPEESLCIDESVIPFIGRLSFRQYLKNKRHRYGVKIFKLCVHDGFTVDFRIYAGKEAVQGLEVSTKIVMELTHEYLNFGRTIYTDNWYTSVNLAHKLLEQNTHLVGTLRANRKQNPKDVVQKKLKKGQVIAQQSDRGIVVLKWKDKRDVLMLSTKHSDTMIETINKRGQTTKKPEIVIDYNKGKALVDICDQRSSYHSPLRKSMKWYRKVAIEIILSTSVLNAMCLYNKVNKTKIGITEFKEMLVKDMCGVYEETNKEVEHKLSKSGKRTRCVKCYDEMVKQGGRKHAQRITKQSNYWCAACQKVYCIECFFDDHRVRAK